jgi:iron complex transport system substrate-binding protein
MGMTIHRIALVACIVFAFVGSMFARARLEAPLRPEVSRGWRCERIVSMAPSITETLYELGLGERVVGVTRYCRYPPDAAKKTRVGGHLDPNIEAIVALRPDLVVLLEEQSDLLPLLEKLKIETLVVSHQSIAGIIDSLRAIGRKCGRGAEGRRLAGQLERRLARIELRTRDMQRPRVLFVLDRVFGEGHISSVYVAGQDDYFDSICRIAGGQNAYQLRGPRNPIVSPEGLRWLNPDVIIDLVRPDMLEKLGRETVLADWRDLSTLKAVREGRVLIFDQSHDFVPGPRVVRLVEDLARQLHPEVDWDQWINSSAAAEANWPETE